MKQRIWLGIKDSALHNMLYHLFTNKGYIVQKMADFSKDNFIKNHLSNNNNAIYIVDYLAYQENKAHIVSLIADNNPKFICLLPNNLTLKGEHAIESKMDFYNIPKNLKTFIDLF